MEKGENRTGSRNVLGAMWISNTWMEFPKICVTFNVMEASWDLNPTHEQVAPWITDTRRTGDYELTCSLT